MTGPDQRGMPDGRPSDAIVDGPVVSLASPVLAHYVGRGVELVLANLGSSVAAVPIEDLNTLLLLVA
jgi:hypothetical protein